MPIRNVRLLLIDNKQYILDMLEDLFPTEINNLSITKVNTEADSIEEVLRKIENGYFDIAVIDKRLILDSDPKDESGIELANKIAQNHPWLKIMMLTSYADWKDIEKKLPKFDNYGEPILCGYISKKDDPPGEWCTKLKEVIRDNLRINFNIKIELEEFPFNEPGALLIGTLFNGERIEEKHTELINNLSIELIDLFAKIYHDDKIIIKPVYKQGHGGTPVVKVYPGKNLTEIVKFGEREKIEIEYENYKVYVAGKISNRTVIEEGKFARTKNLGAIAYSLIGADVREIKDFTDYYNEKDAKTIINFLSGFFKENCQTWYSNLQQNAAIDLRAAYSDYLKFTELGLQEAVNLKLPDFRNKRVVDLDDFGITFENPVFHAFHSTFKTFNTRTCITHGDLNSKNILVDRNMGWLIDFYSTGWGHCLRDFIKLETDMKFMFTSEFNLAYLIRMEKTLLAQDNFEQDYDSQNFDDEEALKKLFICIKHLRKLAFKLNKPYSIGEYYVGLFFTTLRTLQFYKVEGFTKSQDKKRLKFAFISAGLILNKLKDMGLVSSAPGNNEGGDNNGTPNQPELIQKAESFYFNVFICHSSKDKKEVLDIIQAFKRKGVTYWVDHEQIEYGDEITGKIEDGLKNSKYTLVLLSKNLGKSNWCRKEYGPILNREYNKKSGKKVIPLKIDDCNDDDIPLLLYDKRRADYSNKEEFDDLLDYLKN